MYTSVVRHIKCCLSQVLFDESNVLTPLYAKMTVKSVLYNYSKMGLSVSDW